MIKDRSMRLMLFVKQLCLACVLPVIACIAGCGSEEGPEYASVKGTVTLDGQPVVIGTVLFLPTGETKGPASAGAIHSDGTYELVGPKGAGVVVGTHKILVKCPEAGSGPDTAEDPQAGNAPCVVPAKYGNERTSQITKEVASGENSIDIQLQK